MTIAFDVEAWTVFADVYQHFRAAGVDDLISAIFAVLSVNPKRRDLANIVTQRGIQYNMALMRMLGSHILEAEGVIFKMEHAKDFQAVVDYLFHNISHGLPDFTRGWVDYTAIRQTYGIFPVPDDAKYIIADAFPYTSEVMARYYNERNTISADLYVSKLVCILSFYHHGFNASKLYELTSNFSRFIDSIGQSVAMEFINPATQSDNISMCWHTHRINILGGAFRTTRHGKCSAYRSDLERSGAVSIPYLNGVDFDDDVNDITWADYLSGVITDPISTVPQPAEEDDDYASTVADEDTKVYDDAIREHMLSKNASGENFSLDDWCLV